MKTGPSQFHFSLAFWAWTRIAGPLAFGGLMLAVGWGHEFGSVFMPAAFLGVLYQLTIIYYLKLSLPVAPENRPAMNAAVNSRLTDLLSVFFLLACLGSFAGLAEQRSFIPNGKPRLVTVWLAVTFLPYWTLSFIAWLFLRRALRLSVPRNLDETSDFAE